MFVVESREVVKFGDLSEVLRQFVQLLVLLPVQVGLHKWADLVCVREHTDVTPLIVPQTLATLRGRVEDGDTGHQPSVHSVGS